MGVSEYQLIESLPKDLGKSLPSIQELEKELNVITTNYDAVLEQVLSNELTADISKDELKTKPGQDKE